MTNLWLDHDPRGSGPTVVFLPGAGLVGLDFRAAQRLSAPAVIYDRAGTGWSEQVALPRSATAVAEELHTALIGKGISGPVILAGHSLGAFYARRYAQLFPTEVAGLLLIDPGHEDIFDFLPAEARDLDAEIKRQTTDLPDLTDAQVAAARGQYAQLYAAWPDDEREALVDYHLTHWRTAIDETRNFDTEIYEEVRAGGAPPDVPLLVLTAGARNPVWEQFANADLVTRAHAGIDAMHRAMAAAVPRGEHRVVPGASHGFLQSQHPEAIADAVAALRVA
ncbi:Pimeloyl-ACP methyl ester carboxylesterase [Asanoa hainanensis]|uniref:Pimeloyl-ACP methyl ester carboxylesterase n=1 Tax=Asanoa hainanensis TaxID=560556 RepID=A0A239P717_9ACTN|nr:alpha/beta hydrolase [Asanoa hainanensis]SNT62623.1 Pimeloyl-ACP methyl ester carboxylesterase [Asanoa hainanensis]